MNTINLFFRNATRSAVLALTTVLLVACQAETNAVAQEAETQTTANQTNEAVTEAPEAAVSTEQSQLDSATYKAVKTPMKVSTGDKIEVVELFWFGCGHCFALEPSLKTWKQTKPENVGFVKVPALFSKRWEFHGQAFYTMQALGMPDEAYDQFFRQLHIQRQPINTLSQFTKFMSKFGKDEKEVEAAFNSFGVDSQMRAARKITRDSGATGVPAIIVDGKYLTSETLAGKGPQLFNVVNQLVSKAAAER